MQDSSAFSPGPLLIHPASVQVGGRRVVVHVADPKLHARHGVDEELRGSRSGTPMEGMRDSRLGSAQSRHSSCPGMHMHQHMPADSGECNPAFWGWLHSQGVPTLDGVHKLYAIWQNQGCPVPTAPQPASLSRNVSFSSMQMAPMPQSCASAPPGASGTGHAGDDNVRPVLNCDYFSSMMRLPFFSLRSFEQMCSFFDLLHIEMLHFKSEASMLMLQQPRCHTYSYLHP